MLSQGTRALAGTTGGLSGNVFETGDGHADRQRDRACCKSGFITIPDPFTRKFDELGAFTEPTQLLANLQVAYSPSPRVKLVGTLANVIKTCFGGSQEPWVQNHKVCGYNTGYSGCVGNFYNPGNTIQPSVAYPYGPLIGLQPQGIAVGSTSLLQAFLAVQIKL